MREGEGVLFSDVNSADHLHCYKFLDRKGECNMELKEKLAKMEEIMELDEGVLKETDVLEDFDEWDSIAMLSFIAMMDSDFEKTVTGEEVRSFVTVQDALERMV